MYEQHFGLTKRPFGTKPRGSDVFIGPQTAKTMSGFRKALVAQDAVVTVSGAVGTGKTTLVERALDAIGRKYKTIRVGRIQMDASDVLESLLIVLGVKDRPSGTIQRFTALRKKLQELQDAGTRVFILVEDALRAGADTLAELEALTVADAGESDGASIVLMGDERLFEFMKTPQLGQLQQRVRQRHRIQPLGEAELRGYLKHCLRQAGGDFDQIFDARSAELLQALSAGIPRVANNVADAVLVAAATQGVSKVSAKMIAATASDEFGLSVDDFDFSIPVVADDSTADDVVDDALAATGVPEPEPVKPAAVTDPAPVVAAEPKPAAVPDPAPVLAAEPMPAPEALSDPKPVIEIPEDAPGSVDDSEDIPHLIQDTMPDLAILSQRYAVLEKSEHSEPRDPVAEPPSEAPADDIPELKVEPAPAAASEAPESQQKTPDAKNPEVEAAVPSSSVPQWELAKEPEFEFVTEVVPVLEADQALSPAAELVDEAIPELQLELEPDSVAEDAAQLAIDSEPVTDSASDVSETQERVSEDDLVPVADVSDVTKTRTPTPDNAPPELPQDSAMGEIPEWDRDPTLAELKPDLDALEQAMAFTHGEPVVGAKKAAVQPEQLAESVADADEIPEIILDKSIKTGIDNLDIEEPSDICPPKAPSKPDPELDRIAADIANAKSLEDIDDIMAETLFGTGISMIAAQIAANPPPDDAANVELELVQEPPAEPTPNVDEKPTQVAEKNSAPNRSEISEEISIETRPPVANTGLDLSASQRLKTVRALNAHGNPPARKPKSASRARKSNPADAAEADPDSIEDQINTSITQTLKALKVPSHVLDDEPEEEPKKGFLSRFRRS